MANPSQTFSTIAQLLNYINSLIVTNGINAITGEEANNVLNGLGNFIVKYSVNANLAGISSSSGVVPLSKPVTIVTVVPTSLQWPDDVQNEYYIVNATGVDIPLTSGYSYIDAYGTVQTVIPLRTAIHIGKAINGNWYQLNNVGGSGGGSNLPPQTGHDGEALFTNGTSTFWASPVKEITGADFFDANQYIDASLDGFKYVILWDDGPARLYNNPLDNTYPASSWKYIAGGGFQILIPGFDSNSNPKPRFTIWLKGLNS